MRIWDVLQLVTPWLLLAISTGLYLAGVSAHDEGHFGPQAGIVLGLVAASGIWVLFGHTLPVRRGSLRPVPAGIYLAGMLVLCAYLMGYSEVFLVFTIAGFFHAYLLTPWPMGVLGVLATSVVLNGSAMGVLESPTPATLTEFALIVVLQTAAIGVGVVLLARTGPQEREREELVERLEAALHENAGLHAQLLAQAREAGVLDERQRLAREIHDTLAQGLTGIITQLQATERSTTTDGDEHVRRALLLARSSLTDARRSVRALAPQELQRAQFPDALRKLTKQWGAETGTEVRFEVTGEPIELSPAIEVSLFRVAQEALANIAKHAEARRAVVTLSYAGPEVLLDVRDDGRGLVTSRGEGFGLTSMRQRIRGIGGHVDVHGAENEGTSVSARVPAIAPPGTRMEETS
ncbi:sensor histidine kinase [Brevibacterium album]|uniref:sensor histidine kinase n=1 Tax=Brevibacterium album TaxID=417948 RepID=UPI0006868A2C|nr:sensor histidine kinase [Brevibacterium album]